MADPGMMSLFGEDGNIFSEGLEGLGECGYPENPVNPMGQQMPIDQGFASLQPSLHHPSTNQNQTKLTHFDHYNQYEQQKMHLMDQPNRMMSNTPGNGLASPHSQYHTPPVPQVPHGGSGGGQMGVYPGMQNERHGQSFVDSSSMWGPRAVQVPDQIRAPYQQQQPQPQPPQPAPSGPPAQGHPQHMQQMGSYMARGDFSMQQHGQPQQRMSQFSQGQEGLNQGNPFIATSGPGHLSHVPQQSPSMAPSLRHSVQQFHHHPSTALHGESVAHSPRFSPNPPQQGAVRPQTLNFSSRSQTVPSPTINNSGQYSRYPYSNLNQGLVNNTGMNQNLGLTNNTPMNQSVPRYPNAVGFPSNSGQGLMHQQPIHPSGSLNQMNTQTMHPSQPQGTYASPPPMSPMKAMSNPAGTPPPQVRPGSAGIPMEVGSYPNMPHPQPSHQPPGAMGIGQRNMGPRNMQQSRPFIGMSSAPRELTGHMRPNGCPGVGLGDPQAIQERLIPGQQHPGQQPSFQQLPTCPPLQPHPGLHHQSSPPHPHHQPWAQLHPSPQNTPQKVPVHQHSPSEPFLEKPVPDMTQVSGPNAQLVKSDDYLPSIEQQPQQKKKKKKNNHIVAEDPSKGFGKDDFPGGVDNQELNRNSLDGSQEEKKKKKRSKAKKDPKEPKEPKEKKEPKEPKTPKAPKIPKEPKEKKAKTATPKSKSSKKSSNKKPDSEASALKKKVNKGKTEGSENSDLDKTPPPSPPPEEDEDPGVQKRRSSRQVKRKRYTEDLEFKISDEEADDADAAGRDSPSNTSQSEQQESVDAEGPVVEKIMSSRSVKKQKESGEEVEIEEFYVKYKNFSYLHCQWASIEDLEKDKRIQQKIKRFKAKQGQNKFLSEIEDELFNPDYVEVDRIMDFARSTDDRGEGRVIKGSYKFHAIITTFEMILTDCPELRNIPWRCVVIDEAHRLKNRNCKLLEGLKMMDLEHKVLLTGTPLQNTVEELFSLLHFLEPSRFPSETTFMQEFGDLKTEEQVQKLQAILKPMMLRRLKEDVEKNLAPKEETIIEVELTNIQKKYYRAILEKNFTFLSKGGGQANVPNLLNTMMELRKCCNHPYLINGAEEKILEEFKETHNAESPDFQLQAMIQAAGKLVLIDKLLPKLKAGGHRVLIFSQMVRCLDILEDYLIQRRYPYERIDGRVRGNLRQAAIDRFSKPDSDRFVFLLCTRAGGLGINLTAADTCIIFDSDWNPQNDLQVQQLSKKEIEDLLRKGAYGALMDEEDEGSKFCEEDIDQILLRRTHTITIESEGKGSTFAKASFVASGNRTDISLDDPNFWQKWAKKAELDIDALNGRNNLVIDTPRVRKQTRLYSAVKEDELMEFSDLESDSEEKPCAKPRRPQDKSQGYARSECFRVEKNLLVYGWGRWTDILSHGRYKRQLTEQDVETICRTILVYCLNHYKGDENIKSFIWDLITPTADGQTRALVNHSGLSAPVPRGRKGKKVKAQSTQPVVQDADWLASCNPDALFQEDSYKKHLKHHCNKVLLRVRMLYYLRQEVIGDQADKILEGADSSEADVWIPEPFHAEVPADWWDKEADKSLLIGVFKHGYEKYNSMRADPALCFLERVGMPDAKAIAAEQRGTDMLADGGDGGEFDREDEDPEYKPTRTPFKDEIDEFANSPPEDKEESMEIHATGKHSESNAELGQLYWPNTSTLTTRLRRLITAYQRSYKRQQMRQEALMKTDRRRRRPREEVRALEAEREAIISEKRQKWTRREEADFYRVVSTFGVIFDPVKQQFDWNQFRAFARLDKKSDESLEKYFSCFVAMCRRVCRMPVKPDDEPPDLSSIIEPITEERASRTLYRIELLRKIREQVLHHPQLGERLKLCQPSLDLPEWWECGRHDRDLLVGAAKHGVSRTDYHILNDPELSFLDAHKNFAQNRGAGNTSSLNPLAVGFVQTPPVISSAHIQDEKVLEQAEGKVEESENPAAKEKCEGKEEEEETDGSRKESKQECEAEANSVKNELKSVEVGADTGSKSVSEKGSEEDEEEKLEDDDKSEESSQPEAGAVSRGKNFDEESNASMSTARDETRDGFYMEDGDPSVAQLLHERTFAFSFWPKDRVMINRLDNICEAVLKGKWPVNRRQMFDFQGLIPGYTPTTVDSPLQKRSFAELSMVSQASISGSEDITTSPQLSKEDALNLSVPRQRRRRRRKIEIEAERAAKRRNLMEMVAQLRESQVVSENGQEKVVDLSKASREATSSTSNFSSLSSKFILPNVSTPVSDAFKTQMELLQAGLSRTPTRHLLNGSLVDGEPPMKRRRGRRKNVEGLDLLFMSHKRTSLSAEDAEVTKAFEEDIETPPTRNIPSPGQLDPDTRIPVINLEDGTRLVGEDAPKNKDLVEWLKLHPTYTVDMPSYVPNADVLFSSFQKPKQKRHRCRNPNKLDINTLTGEERVPVVNKRNGKKMGGAMAPPMKDLPRWLEENPEFAVAPDWTDIVKQSGFVPESMFDRLLTGPVVRGEGASRRGRRPKSEIARAAAAAAAVASTSGINPLLVNSLFAGMDLTSLQNLQNLQSLQLAGLMGFPPGLATAATAGGDAKNPAAVLPLMLPGMAGLPNVFGLGGLLNNPLSAATGNTTTASSQGEPEDSTSKGEEKGNENEDENKDSEKSTDAVSAADSANGSVGAATAPAGLPSNPLAFNPFLLSTMAPGLFYPSMFLPPGLGGLTLPGFPALAGLQNAVGSSEEKAADKAEGGPFKDGETLEGSDAEESLDKTAESSLLEDEIAQGEELDSLDGGDEIENNENDE
ncbi:CHD7 isoform 5 [Pongo abelii]|uniref:CHD7 isoform 5 n=1 Tax=Pongo abelii TaxID=9601 RepID=A0A2J8UQW9_PONAB|nr:CHD7 isoform 5 [Pongo abelii]